MWIDKWHILSRAATQLPQGILFKKGKGGQDLINVEWPVGIGLAYAIALKKNKNSDKDQKFVLSRGNKIKQVVSVCAYVYMNTCFMGIFTPFTTADIQNVLSTFL